MSGFWRDVLRALNGQSPGPSALHEGMSCAQADEEIECLRGENKLLLHELDQAVSLRTLGGPPPPCTPGWQPGPSTRPGTADEEGTP